jgi:hypothetical protein
LLKSAATTTPDYSLDSGSDMFEIIFLGAGRGSA